MLYIYIYICTYIAVKQKGHSFSEGYNLKEPAKLNKECQIATNTMKKSIRGQWDRH